MLKAFSKKLKNPSLKIKLKVTNKNKNKYIL